MEYARRATYERGRNRQFVKDLIDVMIDGSWLWQLSARHANKHPTLRHKRVVRKKPGALLLRKNRSIR
jgi:hypothetical protein